MHPDHIKSVMEQNLTLFFWMPNSLKIVKFLSGFNVETVEYKNISFTVWDVGGQDKARATFLLRLIFWFDYIWLIINIWYLFSSNLVS